MASNKDLFQNFSDFRGLDVRSSDLNRPPNAAKELKNFIIEKSFSLGGDRGLKLVANTQNELTDFFMIGSANYFYKDPETGFEVEEIVAIGKKITGDENSGLYRLKTGSLNITYSGTGTWGYSFLYNDSTGKLEFSISSSGGGEISIDDDISGLDVASAIGLAMDDLATAISAVANFSASVTGDDEVYAAVLPLSQVSGLAPGTQSIEFKYWESIPLGISFFIVNDFFEAAVFKHRDVRESLPIFLNKNNCLYIACGGNTPLIKYDGSTVHQAGVFPIFDEDIAITGAASATALVGSFRYYLRFATKDARGNLIYGAGGISEIVTTTAGQAPRITLFSNFVGWEEPGFLIDIGGTSFIGTSNSITLTAFEESLLISRGFGELKAGDRILIVLTGPPTDFFLKRVVSVNRATKTITFDGEPITFSAGASVYWANGAGLPWGYIVTNALQTGVSTINITAKTGLAVGSFLFFPTERRWHKITAIGVSTVTIDGVVDIPSGFYYASSLMLEVWRTENAGIEKFFLSQEKAATPSLSAAFLDTTPDADLGAELVRPTKEPDVLLDCPSIIAEHQGLILAAEGNLRSGRIYFEDFEYSEGFPAATNFYDFLSKQAGEIRALWSDSYDQLAVLKNLAYGSIVGSFRDEIPILNTTIHAEGDVGVSSQNSLIKVRGINIGIGPTGFMAFRGGEVDYELTKQLDSEFLTDVVGVSCLCADKLRINRALAVNDALNQQVYFLIPSFNGTGEEHEGANDSSKMFVLDYSENQWGRRVFPADLSTGGSNLLAYPFIPTAGLFLHRNEVYFHATPYDSTKALGGYEDFVSLLFKKKNREVLEAYSYTSPSGQIESREDYRQDYLDQHVALEYDFKSQWLWLDTPSTDKLFHWLFIYSFPNTDFVPFDLRVRTYIDWDETSVIDDVTLRFDNFVRWHSFKLEANRAKALLVRFSTNTVLQKPTIMGYEIIPGEVDIGLEGVR